MSYGSYALDPVEARISAVPAAAFTVSAGIGAEVRDRSQQMRQPQPQPHVDRPAPGPAEPPGVPLLSPAALRAKGVTGLLEVRRGDLLRAERALSEAAREALRSLAQVWAVAGSDAGGPPEGADLGAESSPPAVTPDPQDLSGARAALARAVLHTRRLAGDLVALDLELRQQLESSVAEVNERAGQVADLNGRIAAATAAGASVPQLTRRREELVLTLARLAGATAQPGAGDSLTVLVDGLRLVTGEAPAALSMAPDGDRAGVTFVDGRPMVLSAGVLAGRLGTLNHVLPDLRDAAARVLARLGDQSVDPGGRPVSGGAEASRELGRLLRELAHSVESSTAYARVAAEVEVAVGPLTGDDTAAPAGGPASARAAASPLGSSASAPVSPAGVLRTLQTAMTSLAEAAEAVAAPGAATVRSTVVSGAPGMATPVVAAWAPAGLASLRVVSLATGAIVGTAQSFHADTPLGDGRECVVGVVTAAGTPQERTVLIDIGRYPTPADLAALINQSNAGVHATLAELSGGTVQLRLESMATGRAVNITIVDGSQPPVASTVLGRLVTVSAPRDTVVEVQRTGRPATTAHGTGRVLQDVLPGVDAHLHMADPSRVFRVGVRIDPQAALTRVAHVAAGAASAVAAARAAGADALASRLLGEIVPVDPAEPAASRSITPRPVPGLSVDRRGLPSLDEDRLLAAYQREPATTAEAVAALGRRLATVTQHFDASAWVVPPRVGPAAASDIYARPASRHGEGSTSAPELSRQDRALLGMLARLQEQAAWLGAQAAVRR